MLFHQDEGGLGPGLGVIVSFGKKRNSLTKKCRNNRTREGWVLGLVFLGVIVSFSKKRDCLTKKCCYIRTGAGWVLGLVFLGVIVSFGKKRVSLTRICCSIGRRKTGSPSERKRKV